MILECPRCAARFLVESSAIPRDGRTVKCAKCGHQWHAAREADVAELNPRVQNDAPDDAEDTQDTQGSWLEEEDASETTDVYPEPEPFEPMPEAVDFDIPPSPHQRQVPPGKTSLMPLLGGAIFLLLCAMAAALFAFRPTLQPHLGSVYDLLGIPDTSGLVLMDVELRSRPSRSKARFIVEGKIINQSNGVRKVPTLRVAMMDKEGKVIGSREYEAEETLKPGEFYPFKAGRLETAFADQVDHLIVDLGNGVELMLREK